MRQWVDERRLMLDSEHFDRCWKEQGERGEAEHRLYFDPTSQRWFKRNNLSNYGNWMAYFQAIQLHNWLFPVAPLNLEGFINEGIHLHPVVSQPHISAVRGATEAEVDALMEKLGFEPIRRRDRFRSYDYFSKVLGVEVNDLHDENALVVETGEVVVIDPVPMMEETSKLTRLKTQNAK